MVRKAKKAAPKKAAKTKPAKATAAKTKPAKKAKAPREPKRKPSTQLELIKGVRYTDLDRLCEQIGNNRDEINELKSSDKSFGQSALRAMRVHGVTGYNHAGVTLTRNQGDETLTVKRDRKGAPSESSGALNQPADPGGDGQEGTGQGAAAAGEALTEKVGDDE